MLYATHIFKAMMWVKLQRGLVICTIKCKLFYLLDIAKKIIGLLFFYVREPSV